MNDDDHTIEETEEDAKLEIGMKILQQRLNGITVRVAHCHECGHMDPTDPYRPVCDLGHTMQPCLITKYRLVTKMAVFS